MQIRFGADHLSPKHSPPRLLHFIRLLSPHVVPIYSHNQSATFTFILSLRSYVLLLLLFFLSFQSKKSAFLQREISRAS